MSSRYLILYFIAGGLITLYCDLQGFFDGIGNTPLMIPLLSLSIALVAAIFAGVIELLIMLFFCIKHKLKR